MPAIKDSARSYSEGMNFIVEALTKNRGLGEKNPRAKEHYHTL